MNFRKAEGKWFNHHELKVITLSHSAHDSKYIHISVLKIRFSQTAHQNILVNVNHK